MKLDVPYHAQETEYYCGPAVLQMVSEFFGEFQTQKNLASLTGLSEETLEKDGTANSVLVETARRAGFLTFAHSGATILEAKAFINQKLPVVVNYIDPKDEEGHFAVLSGYGGIFPFKYLILEDPWVGKNLKIRERKFLSRWKGGWDDKGTERWILVLSKTPMAEEKL